MFIVPPTGVLGFCLVGLNYCITHILYICSYGKINVVLNLVKGDFFFPFLQDVI